MKTITITFKKNIFIDFIIIIVIIIIIIIKVVSAR